MTCTILKWIISVKVITITPFPLYLGEIEVKNCEDILY